MANEPKIRVIGAYQVPNHPDVHLIELDVESPPATVDAGAFGQADPALAPDSWQVAYDERFLESLGSSRSRLIFFLHFVRFDRPLKTPFEDVALPEPTPMPPRLASIVRYEPPD
jgi:hypothetical protein